MKKLIIVAALLALSGCATMPSKYPLPLDDIKRTGKFRENPPVKTFWLTKWEVQDVCAKVNGMGNGIVAASLLMWFRGCAKVPYDPAENCVIICHVGDDDRYRHEYAHCQGHADTTNPFSAM